MPSRKAAALRELQTIPWVGKKTAEDLWSMGYGRVKDLRGEDPEEMYANLCALAGGRVDRCMLYVFRGAVYYASHKEHDPEKLKWWHWKDERD